MLNFYISANSAVQSHCHSNKSHGADLSRGMWSCVSRGASTGSPGPGGRRRVAELQPLAVNGGAGRRAAAARLSLIAEADFAVGRFRAVLIKPRVLAVFCPEPGLECERWV